MSKLVLDAEKVRRDLSGFVTDLMDKGDWDIVVPIMRKGLFVLMSTTGVHLEKIRLFPFYGMTNVNEKAILIVDDKAWHGHTMDNKIKEAISRGADPEKTKTAVFMKHSSCNFPIDYYRHELANLEYQKISAALSVYYDSLCLQLDPDHLVAKGFISCQSLDLREHRHFASAVEEGAFDLGTFYIQESSASLWGRTKFGVADIPLSKLQLNGVDKLLIEEGVQKVRFCLEPDGGVSLMPIFCPEIPIFSPEITTEKDLCSEAVKNGVKLCESLSSEIPRNEILCRDCINFHLQTRALKSLLQIFTKRLRNSGFAIHITDLSWPELEFKYPEFELIFYRLLNGIMNGQKEV